MRYKCYSKVRIITNRYEKNGISIGSIEIILELYNTGDYEVQFFDKNGDLSNVFFSVGETDIVLE